MFYKQHKTLWYQFGNFKHFLKENSEDILASSCVEFSIGLSCNPVWDWVTVGTTQIFTHQHDRKHRTSCHIRLCKHQFYFPSVLWSCFTWIQIHLAKLIPRRFLKPAVFKYPTTVNNPEIYILLPKPCPWMWHLMCGNCVRNGSDRKPETGKICSLKLALFKNPIGAALWYYHADMHIFIESAQRTPTRQAVSAINAVLIIRVIIDSTVLCIVQHTVHRNFQKCNFWWTHSVCLGLLLRQFLTRFLHTRCHIKE